MVSPRRRLRCAYGVILIAACLAAAGCGSSQKTSGKASATAGSGTTASGSGATTSGSLATTGTAKAAKAPIKVFVYGDETVPPPTPPETWIKDIPLATAKAINAAGGINGHPIDVTWCDSKYNANTTLACVRQAITGHYAAVIVPTSSVGQAGADAQLAKANLPVFYAIPNGTQVKNPHAVCPTSTILGAGGGVGFMAKMLGLKKVSVTYANTPTAAQAAQFVKGSLTHVGIDVPASVPAPLGTPDLSASFAQAMSGGSDGLWYFNLPPVLDPSVKQFLASYPQKKLILQDLDSNTLKTAGSAGSGQVYFPAWTQPISSGVPGARAFVSAMKKYGTDPGADISDTWMPLYLPMKLFAEIASTIKGQVTASSVLAATKTAKNVSLGGLVPNYNGAMLGKAGAPCMYQDTIVPDVDKNGTLVAAHKSQFLDAATGKLVKATG